MHPHPDAGEAPAGQRQRRQERGAGGRRCGGPTLYYGAGAGAEPTASAVVADVVDLARVLAWAGAGRCPSWACAEATPDQPILDIEDVQTAWYLRMTAEDKPGVLSDVASICSRAGISIEALIQKEPAEGETRVPVIMVTNRTREGELNKAASEIEALDRSRAASREFALRTPGRLGRKAA